MEEGEGEMANCVTKVRARGAVPGINRVEGVEHGNVGFFHDAQQVESCIGDGASAIGEADQREHRARNPDLGVIGARGFERGERQNHVADRSGANEQTPHYFKPYSLRALSRSTMRASSTARSRVIWVSRSMPVSASPSASRLDTLAM